jgi:hypothetical protein
MKKTMDTPFNRRSPLLAKLGVVALVSASALGLGGVLFSTLNKQAAQFLSVAVGSAVSAALLTLWSVRYTGMLTYLPPTLEEPLLEWDLLQTFHYLNASFDIEAAKLIFTELAPLALAKGEAETKVAISNMSGHWQRIFSTKGLLGLLPPDVQKWILPRGFPAVSPPSSIPENRPADLSRQTALFRELLWLRIGETFDYLASRSMFFTLLKKSGEFVGRVHQFVKQNTSSELQVTVIMSVFALLILRIVLVVLMFTIRKTVSIFYM